MRRFLLGCLLTVMFSLPVNAQINPASIEFIKNFKEIQAELPRERVYLHTDRDWYYFGDRIWYSAYVLEGPYTMPSEMSTVLYVELINPDGELIERVVTRIEKGRGSGSINFKEANERAGKYRIKAYTAWALNFGESYAFKKDLNVFTEDNKGFVFRDEEVMDLQFFAESGHMITGIPTKLAFKAIGADGLSREVSGDIYTEGGDQVTSFSTEYRGMGVIDFTPESGKEYYAMSGGKRYGLPQAMEAGAIMNVKNLDNQFIINVKTKGMPDTRSLLLFAHVRGEVYAASEVRLNANAGTVLIPKIQIPSGVVHFTLLGNDGTPIAERLSLNKNSVDDIEVQIALESMVSGLRDRSGVTTLIRDHTGTPVNATISVSVFDDGIQSYGRFDGDIKSHMLLETELKGHIEDPGYYFSNDSLVIERSELLMMTQGWRAYDMESYLNRDNIKLFSRPEQGVRVFGKITGGLLLRDQKDAPLLYSLGGSDGKVSVLTTDENGEFWIGGMDFTGSQRLQIKANTSRGNENVSISLEEQFSYLPRTDEFIPQLKSQVQPDNNSVDGTEQDEMGNTTLAIAERASAATQESEQFVEVQMSGELDEITVSSSRIQEAGEEDDYATSIARNAGGRGTFVDMDERGYLNALSIEQVLNQLPGVSAIGDQVKVETGFMSISGDSEQPPLFVVNGSYQEYETVRILNTQDIQSIGVLRSAADLAIFGARGSAGAIIIKMRDGARITKPKGYIDTQIQGYQYQMEFYNPKYGVTVPSDREQKDNRITLFWEPNAAVGREGRRLQFWTNDIPSTYRVVIEGVTESGTPFFNTRVFTVVD